MSTGNFHFKNTCIPVLMSEDRGVCEDCNEEQPEGEVCTGCGGKIRTESVAPMEFDEFLNDVVMELNSRLVGFNKAYDKYRGDDRVIGWVDVKRQNYDDEIYATIYITVNPGYYDGACLDYDIEVLQDNKGYMDKKVAQKANRVKQVLKTFGDEYKVAYRFSNGETGYCKVNE